ncbi:MAG: endonuclease III [Anaerolineae bacterium]|nr:endonuclease III [Anaerolineae bacterium]
MNDSQTTLLEIHCRLVRLYGDPILHPSGEPVAALINTILSQNTNDRNRDIAYQQLRVQFPTWEAVRDAPLETVIEAIRPAGLAPSKGPRIQSALQYITEEQGGISLDFLNELPLTQARDWLLSLNGVGPKTAAIVLLFALGRSAFPVDTHVHRVTRRLGLIPDKTSREKAHELLEVLVPPEHYYAFHLNLIALGRQTCHARKPECHKCVVREFCDYFNDQKQEED